MELTGIQLDSVKRSVLFAGLSDGFVMRAVEVAELVKYGAGLCIMEEGEAVRKLGIILDGEAAVYKGAGEAQLLMSILRNGSLIGAATLFSRDAHAATRIRAKHACSVLYFMEETIKTLMQENFNFTQGYLSYLTERIHFLTGRIESIGCTNASDKLYNYLLKNSEDGETHLFTGMMGLADALSMSRASLYRVMDELESAKRIRRDGKTIYIL
ncbi:MAG: Crp/Fnr family transcriptional regulator [Clostridia bacterium]